MYCIVYSILYSMVYNIVYRIVCNIVYSIVYIIKQGSSRDKIWRNSVLRRTQRWTDRRTVHLLSCAFAAKNQTDLEKLHWGLIVDFLRILDKFEFKCRFVKISCRFVKIKSRFVKLSRMG